MQRLGLGIVGGNTKLELNGDLILKLTAPAAQRLRLSQNKGALRLLGFVEAGAASAIDRSGERELRDGENRAANAGKVAIHLAVFVAEDAQLADFSRGVAHRLLAVAFLDGGEDEKRHWSSAAGCERTRRTVSSDAPGWPTRQCRIGRMVSAVIERSAA